MNTFCSSNIDPLHNQCRDPLFVIKNIISPQARFIPFYNLQPLVYCHPQSNTLSCEIAWMSLNVVESWVQSKKFEKTECSIIRDVKYQLVFLGVNNIDHFAYFAIDVSESESENHIFQKLNLSETASFRPLRKLLPSLSSTDSTILGRAKQLLEWHSINKYCSSCAHLLSSSVCGFYRMCTNNICKITNIFPRTDPSIIVLVIDHSGDKCLLVNKPEWKRSRYSCVAGFIDPCESPKATVRREVLEETGIIVDRVKFICHQPWPFPQSLMLAFFAQTSDIEQRINIDNFELKDAKWIDRNTVIKALTSNPPNILSQPNSNFSKKKQKHDHSFVDITSSLEINVPDFSTVSRYLMELWAYNPDIMI